MAATPPNGDKRNGLQGTTPDRAAQPSRTDYKAQLDRKAAECQGAAGRRTAGQSDSLVSTLVDQGKQLLGLDNGRDNGNDKAASSTSDLQSGGAEGITDTHVHEFIRDAHRSQKITPRAAEG